MTGTDVYYFTQGAAPNRKFVVTFDTAGFFSGGGYTSFQMVLFETTNEVQIHTSLATNTTKLKVQGIENGAGTIGLTSPGRNSVAVWTGLPDGNRFYQDFTYMWTPTTYLNNPNIQNPKAYNVLDSITYTVKVTNSSGCMAAGSIL